MIQTKTGKSVLFILTVINAAFFGLFLVKTFKHLDTISVTDIAITVISLSIVIICNFLISSSADKQKK